MRNTFDAVDERLADGRRYLLGDEAGFTRVDMLFAVSASLVLRPPEFAGGRVVPESTFTIEELSSAAQEELRPFLVRPAAKFCFRIFQEERGRATTLSHEKCS
jgi:hypothetical protein